ncbi:hypothetical protein MASR2M36_29590 [Providencia sp.]
MTWSGLLFAFALAREEILHNTATAAADNGSNLLLFIMITLGKSIQLTFREVEYKIRANIQRSD